MIAIVTKNNVPGIHFAKPLYHPRRRLRLPIPHGDGPVNHCGITGLARCAIKKGAPKSKRRADAGCAAANGAKDGIVAPFQLVHDLLPREKHEIRMGVAVVTYRVASRRDFCGQTWELPDVFPEQEKCGLDIVLAQQIQQIGRCRGIRAVVKSQCAAGGGSPNNGPK
jgi:hypothetical protein